MRNSRTTAERTALVAALTLAKVQAQGANPDEFAANGSEACFDSQIDVIENDLTPAEVANKYGDMSAPNFNQDVFDHASAASDFLLGNLDADDICSPVESQEPNPDMVNEGENRYAVNAGSGAVNDDQVETEEA